MAWTRSHDADGRFVFHRAKIAAATFQHGTNRTHDPTLHTHVVLMNAGIAENNRTGALYSPAFVRQKMMLGAMYRVEMAHQMEREFGLTSSRVKSWLELDGVDKDLAKHFSSRRNEIEALLEKYGAHNAKLAEAAALISRPTKESVPRAELFDHWQAVGHEMGWGREQARDLGAPFHVRDLREVEVAAVRLALARKGVLQVLLGLRILQRHGSLSCRSDSLGIGSFLLSAADPPWPFGRPLIGD